MRVVLVTFLLLLCAEPHLAGVAQGRSLHKTRQQAGHHLPASRPSLEEEEHTEQEKNKEPSAKRWMYLFALLLLIGVVLVGTTYKMNGHLRILGLEAGAHTQLAVFSTWLEVVAFGGSLLVFFLLKIHQLSKQTVNPDTQYWVDMQAVSEILSILVSLALLVPTISKFFDLDPDCIPLVKDDKMIEHLPLNDGSGELGKINYAVRWRCGTPSRCTLICEQGMDPSFTVTTCESYGAMGYGWSHLGYSRLAMPACCPANSMSRNLREFTATATGTGFTLQWSNSTHFMYSCGKDQALALQTCRNIPSVSDWQTDAYCDSVCGKAALSSNECVETTNTSFVDTALWDDERSADDQTLIKDSAQTFPEGHTFATVAETDPNVRFRLVYSTTGRRLLGPWVTP